MPTFFFPLQQRIECDINCHLFIYLLCLTFIATNIETANTIPQMSYFFTIIKKNSFGESQSFNSERYFIDCFKNMY